MSFDKTIWRIRFQILFVADLLISTSNTVKIEELIVPELLQLGNSSSAVLDCRYSDVSDQVTIQWFYNGSETPVYQWSTRTEPEVAGILEGRLDLSFKASSVMNEERRALHIVALDPQLSGQYTCRVLDHDAEARQTKTMLVFSPEKDFQLEFVERDNNVEVKCLARGLYPQPDLVLEHKGMMIGKQQQRIWRNESMLFDVESKADLPIAVSYNQMEQITCRLQLPQAGYTAIKKELLHFGPDYNSCSPKTTYSSLIVLLLINCIRP